MQVRGGKQSWIPTEAMRSWHILVGGTLLVLTGMPAGAWGHRWGPMGSLHRRDTDLAASLMAWAEGRTVCLLRYLLALTLHKVLPWL